MENIISLEQARVIYKDLSGREKSLEMLGEEIRLRPHLGVFNTDQSSSLRILEGVRERRWAYFVKTRLALYGPEMIFSTMVLE